MTILQDLKINGETRLEQIVSALQGWLAHVDPLDQDKEHTIVLSLNVRNKVKCVDVVSVGTLDYSFIHPREVYRRAISVGAAKIILAHNHPSMDCTPSTEDELCTRRILEAGEIVGIHLVDHIIFIPSSHYSFAEQGSVV